METPEKKRRLLDEAGEASISAPQTRHPLKKRFTSSINIQQASTPPVITSEPEFITRTSPIKSVSLTFPTNLESYTKDALLQNMRSAKDEALHHENRYNITYEKHFSKEAKQSLLRIDWSLIQAEIVFMAKLLIGVDIEEPPALTIQKMTLNQQKDWNDHTQLTIKELGIKALTRLESWSKQAELIERKFRLEDDIMLQRVIVSDWLKNEIQDLHTSYQRGQQLTIEFQNGLDDLLAKTNYVAGNVKSARSDLDIVTEQLDQRVQDLVLACKRRDRSKSKPVAALAFGGLGDIEELNASENNNNESSLKEENKIEASPSKEENPVEKQSILTAEQAVKTQLEEHKLILATREKEIEDLKRDRQLLLRDEERLLSTFKVSDEQLSETEYIKNLKLSTEHFRDRCYYLEQRRIDIEREIDMISASRQQLIEQAKSEKMAQEATMEAETKRLENDLNRIRGQRDHFQLLVEEQKTKDAREKESHQKIITFANQGKRKIASLEDRINRLKNDQEVAGPFAKEASDFNLLKENLNHMSVLLLSLENNEDRPTLDHHNSMIALDENLKKWKSVPIMQEYETSHEEAQKALLMINCLEKSEGQLLEEIDRVAGIYSKLEEQQSKKSFDFTQKRDQSLKLQAEKSKYAQTFASLIAEKEKQISAVPTLRMTKEKQGDLIKQLEEKEKVLELQVYEKENKICKLHKAIEDERTDLENVTHLCESFRITLDQNEALLIELQKVLKEKSKLMDEEKDLQDGIQENYEKMRKRWDKISQGDNPAEQQLVDECEELRALLKCSTCRQRVRSHILIRCMHTFCKNCINARLETRQRRCPTCSEPFGANDVRYFYL